MARSCLQIWFCLLVTHSCVETVVVYHVQFKLPNEVCLRSFIEDDSLSPSYQSMQTRVEKMVAKMYDGRGYFVSAEVTKFSCDPGVLVGMDVKVNQSISETDALAPIKDVVASGTYDNTSLADYRVAMLPDFKPPVYVALQTAIPYHHLCLSISEFRNNIAKRLIAVSDDAVSSVSSARVVFLPLYCRIMASNSFSKGKMNFYIAGADLGSGVVDVAMTKKAYKVIDQMVYDGSTWKLGGLFNQKVSNVDILGILRPTDIGLSVIEIVYIGFGIVLGIVLALIALVSCSAKCCGPKPAQDKNAKALNHARALYNLGFEKDIFGNSLQPIIGLNGEILRWDNGQGLDPSVHFHKADEFVEFGKLQRPSVAVPPSRLFMPVSRGFQSTSDTIAEVVNNDLDLQGLRARRNDYPLLALEFENLELGMPRPSDYSAEVAVKNSVNNEFPWPETRVVLSLLPGESYSDYINASFVKGSNDQVAYIAAQNPIPNTINDFWRMVWENKIELIVMAAPFVQAGKEACTHYWPADSIVRHFGDIEVQLVRKEVKPDFMVNALTIKKDMEARDVKLIRYKAWPQSEDGLPDSPKSVVGFLLEVRDVIETETQNPLFVIHCRNGTGLTGMFLAIDIGMHRLEESGKVNVPDLVARLRNDRAGAVQTLLQYQFVYKALYEYALYLSSRSKEKEDETP